MKIVVFNKPFDVLSQFREDSAHLTVSSFINDPDLRIAGRLDLDSEGLMFLTDHGGLNQFITHPSNKKYKTYLVQLDGDITEEALQQLRKGVELADGLTLPATAIKVSEPEWLWERNPPVRYRASIPTSWVEISICEGRNRQVRRMTATVGFPTLRLIRTKIGSIDLVRLGLQPGEQAEIEPLLYPDFKGVPEDKPYRSRSYVKKPGGTGGKPIQHKKPEGDKKDPNKKKSGTKRIWQMDENEKPRRKTNGTTRPNTKAPRGRNRNGR
ncbi:rRNA large subunit pseudouridine synthase E [Acinetobacter sp. S40]|uniref:rRNA large subunit pseudouridine synthase E n=1 Tax=unclassified Acinetobacter TaxID=196816 RepID=UPI00190E0667|nr:MULTISPECIES: rRNA large subunit pseudouridine synthase E [unclassified Acinetobacter]MBJ9985318.1 rRNA large subunit pseudouridine synthase E [Acinetobacter sp. S40]MBK0063880.1 rRNA large subunit pseudouridine synthase E [Acinetobacter sp. S55]MBK0067052.1 rRNA large subunit pseudouridine synthase E [Acinetobacter sp. S54]